MKKILVRTCSHLGDYVILSGAVRHFRTTDARSCERTVQIGGRPYARCLSGGMSERQ